jgi:PLD-like domain
MPLDASRVGDGVVVRAYPGRGSVLLAFDVPDALKDDLAGFAVWFTPPDGEPTPLYNRLTFDDPITTDTTPQQRQAIQATTDTAPLQKFHWTHFPSQLKDGTYHYRVVAMLFKQGSERDLEAGPEGSCDVEFLGKQFAEFQLGFTRGYVSSQAYARDFHNAPLVPSPQPIDYDTTAYTAQYEWLGSTARPLVFDLIAEAQADESMSLDVFSYDFNEPDIIRELVKLGGRVRVFQDNAPLHVATRRKNGTMTHPLELDAIATLQASAGADHVKVGSFSRFQHNKVMVLRRGKQVLKALAGSANFSVRGLYVQSNSVFVFSDDTVPGLYAQTFDQAWKDPHTAVFEANEISEQWYPATSAKVPAGLSVCFSPHKDPDLSLQPVAHAIHDAKSSVLFAIMELDGGGPVLDEVRKLKDRPDLYAFGTTQSVSGDLKVTTPGQESPYIPFAYLAEKVPPPFQAEYGGGKGQVIHHKFVVVDFNTDNHVVYAGSSNLAAGGESSNGDNLVAIHDAAIVNAYAVEAIGLIDHYRFRAAQQAANDDSPLRLRQRSERWAAPYFDPTDAKYRERKVFASPPVADPPQAEPDARRS